MAFAVILISQNREIVIISSYDSEYFRIANLYELTTFSEVALSLINME